MRLRGLKVPGSVVTRATAPGYLERIAKQFYSGLDVNGAFAYDMIAADIVKAGFLTWEQVEEIEIKAVCSL